MGQVQLVLKLKLFSFMYRPALVRLFGRNSEKAVVYFFYIVTVENKGDRNARIGIFHAPETPSGKT